MSANNFADPVERIETSLNTPMSADRTLHGSRVKISKASVKSVKSLTYDTYELVLKIISGENITPKPGQYATIKPASLDRPRSFSFARSPEAENPGEHSFFIRVVPNGKFSEWLHDAEKLIGEEVVLSGPLGYFGLDASDAPIVCIAGGSGMSAIYALLEDACIQQTGRDVLFLYGARSQKDLYCLDKIAAISKKWNPKNSFEFAPVLSEEPSDSDWKGATGFVTEYFKTNYIDSGKISPDKCKAFFCGPPPMIDSGVDILISAGMDKTDIFFDKFEDARSPAPVIDNTLCVLCDECLLVKPLANCIVEVSKANAKGFTLVNPQETLGLYYGTLHIDETECIRCYACKDVCPANAISPDYAVGSKTLAGIVRAD